VTQADAACRPALGRTYWAAMVVSTFIRRRGGPGRSPPAPAARDQVGM